MQDKVNVVDSKIGVNPLSDGFEDCLTTWQGLTDVHQGVLEITSALPELQRQVSAGLTKDFEALNATTRELEIFRANTSAQVNELKVGLQEAFNIVNLLGDEQEAIMTGSARAPSLVHGDPTYPIKEEIDALKL